MEALTSQRAHVRAQLCQRLQVAPAGCCRIRRHHAQNRTHRHGHLRHQAPVLIVHIRIARRVPVNFAVRLRVVRPAQQIIAARQRCKCALKWQNFQPMPRQRQVAHNLRPQQTHNIRKHRVLEAGMQFLCHRCTANNMALLQHQHLAPGTRQVGSCHQAVMPAANNNCIVAFGHRQLTRLDWDTECGNLRIIRRAYGADHRTAAPPPLRPPAAADAQRSLPSASLCPMQSAAPADAPAPRSAW